MFYNNNFIKITFIDRVFDEFLLINQINLGNIESNQFFVESPVFTILGLILNINDFEARPELDGTRTPTFILLNFTKSCCFGEI